MDYLQTNRKQVYIAGLVIGRGKKSNFGGIFRDKIAVIFGANLAGKQSVKKRRILWLFSGQILLEIDWFCFDQTSVFDVFLMAVIICSFNNNMFQK